MIFFLGILAGVLFFTLIQELQVQQETLHCNPTTECVSISKKLDISHIAIGVTASIISFGVYLLFFSKGDEAILKRLEEEKNKKLAEEKFTLISKALDENEARVLKAIKEQEGIQQNTLRLRTDLSKAKVSQILTSFEKKGLIKREKQGKSFAVYLTENV